MDTTTITYPDAPCMEYLPTFTPKMAQMQVNIPYKEHLGYYYNIHYAIGIKSRFSPLNGTRVIPCWSPAQSSHVRWASAASVSFGNDME